MNQTFSFPRFLLLVKAEYAEKGRIQVLTAGLLLVALLVMMLPIMFVDDSKWSMSEFHGVALLMVVLFGGSLYTGLAFSQYGPRDKGMAALMVPASRLEKFLTPLVLNLLFIVPFMVLFLVLEDWTIDYANAKLSTTSPWETYRKLPESMLFYLTSLYMIIQGVVFLGSLYFTKSSYVKTATTFFIIFLAFVAANLGIVHFLVGDANPSSIVAFPFWGWEVLYYLPSYHSYQVSYFKDIQNLMYLLPILITISLWYITYVRLKEKEI